MMEFDRFEPVVGGDVVSVIDRIAVTWIQIDDIDLPAIPRENHTVYPSYGDLLLYPGYRNEQEILVPCGPTCFKSPAGELAGNHFATLDTPREELRAIEQRTLRDGMLDATLRLADE